MPSAGWQKVERLLLVDNNRYALKRKTRREKSASLFQPHSYSLSISLNPQLLTPTNSKHQQLFPLSPLAICIFNLQLHPVSPFPLPAGDYDPLWSAPKLPRHDRPSCLPPTTTQQLPIPRSPWSASSASLAASSARAREVRSWLPPRTVCLFQWRRTLPSEGQACARGPFQQPHRPSPSTSVAPVRHRTSYH